MGVTYVKGLGHQIQNTFQSAFECGNRDLHHGQFLPINGAFSPRFFQMPVHVHILTFYHVFSCILIYNHFVFSTSALNKKNALSQLYLRFLSSFDKPASIHCHAAGLWRVERVIILFCYSICNSSIYILVFNIFVTFTILILSF